MKKGLIKQGLIIAMALVLSVLLGFRTQDTKQSITIESFEKEVSVIDQEVLGESELTQKVVKLYNKNELIGVVTDKEKLDELLEGIYIREYKSEFEDTKLGFVDDVYYTEELSHSLFENVDQEIFNYIYKEKLIAIEVPKIEFANGSIIYVKNLSDFNQAREKFIKGYVSDYTYDMLRNNEKIPRLKTYGEQEIDFRVDESMILTTGFASIEDIYLDETAVLNFLSFGETPNYETYTVKEFDMIDGIAVLNRLSINQLMSMNQSTIKDAQQILVPGTELNVTKFNSPFKVVVTKERWVEEVIHPESPVYRNDPTLREGLTKVEVREENGLKDVVYEDVYENDVPTDSYQIKSRTTKEPVRGVILVGTYQQPRVGSGSFIWPMYNARIICGWYCYAGHAAVDIASRSNGGYGPIYAADRGFISSRGYDGTGGRGYYVIIDHNNGFKTYYYHMNGPAYLPAGAAVAKGEQIGYVGMTGRTTAPHVHFEIRYYGVKHNPCNYIGC